MKIREGHKMPQEFKHIPIKIVKDAPPKVPKVVGRKKNEITESNKQNRLNHSAKLINYTNMIKKEWQEDELERRQNNLPIIPEAIPLFLKIDPISLPIEDLRVFGIEVIGELEDGYIIGSSSDISLSELEKKISKFANNIESKAAGLWDVFHGKHWRPQHILSPSLFDEWNSLKDEQQFNVDVGIACLGTENIPSHPEGRKNQLKDYEKAVVKWKEKKEKAYNVWKELALDRAELLNKFVRGYNGTVIELYEGELTTNSHLPDSFTCRIRISGKGLKDLVLNFPYVFDISEVQEINLNTYQNDEEDNDISDDFRLLDPSSDAPYVCVIDSGIQERHVLLRNAVDSNSSRSWVGSPTDVADYVRGGGHGTRVAGALLYPRDIFVSSSIDPICWIQNARVLDSNNRMPINLFPPKLLEEIVNHFYFSPSNTRIYNQSLNTLYPCRLVHMSPWAAAIDMLSWSHDILFVVSAGNLSPDRPSASNLRLGIRDHLSRGRNYPKYLLEPSSRISDPGQSFQSITVGSVGIGELKGLYNSLSKHSEPSSFSCAGPGIWGTIKPEVVEFGGDFAVDVGNPPNFITHRNLSPELVRSTMFGGKEYSRDAIGTSFAAPKVTHILAALEKNLPKHPTLLYRALLIQSARWPKWAENARNKDEIILSLGYGIPDINRAIHNSENRVTLITSEETIIKAKQVHIYEVKIPKELRNPAEDFNFRLDITLSYKAEPRRTRRNKRRYLSTWLDWKTSKKNESSESFLNRVIEHTSDELIDDNTGEDSGMFNWMIREQDRYGSIQGINRNNGTIQKDWAYIKSHELEKSFYIAVIGHKGWNVDPEASVPYSMAITFESINPNIEIYSKIALLNEIEIEERIDVEYEE
jgi:hypothetical protein